MPHKRRSKSRKNSFGVSRVLGSLKGLAGDAVYGVEKGVGFAGKTLEKGVGFAEKTLETGVDAATSVLSRKRGRPGKRGGKRGGGTPAPYTPSDYANPGNDGAAAYETNLVGSDWATQSQSVPKILANGPQYQSQAGGKKSKKRRRKGGFFGAVVNQAVVPFALLGAQQMYASRRRKGHRHHHTSKMRK
jgi:hypothetical protein